MKVSDKLPAQQGSGEPSVTQLMDRLPKKALNLQEKSIVLNLVKNTGKRHVNSRYLEANKNKILETYFDNKSNFSTKDFKDLFQSLYDVKGKKELFDYSDFVDEVAYAAANVIAENKNLNVRKHLTDEYTNLILQSLSIPKDLREILETNLKDKITEKLKYLYHRNYLIFNNENIDAVKNSDDDTSDQTAALFFKTVDYEIYNHFNKKKLTEKEKNKIELAKNNMRSLYEKLASRTKDTEKVDALRKVLELKFESQDIYFINYKEYYSETLEYIFKYFLKEVNDGSFDTRDDGSLYRYERWLDAHFEWIGRQRE